MRHAGERKTRGLRRAFNTPTLTDSLLPRRHTDNNNNRPSAKSDPLITVCAGSTTRGVPFPDEHSLALFRFLLPSLARTADCGFRYLAVVGYDVGDGFFDGAAGKAKVCAPPYGRRC